MTHFMRYTAICLWLTLLIGGIGSLGVLPVLRPLVSIDLMPVVAAGGLAAAFICVAWTVNRIGMRRLARLMRSADVAEREGLSAEAEAALRQALAALDRFWVSPANRRNALIPLAGRLARFYLSQARLDDAAEDFIAQYLRACPEDEEVAEQWAQQVYSQARGSVLAMEMPELSRQRGEPRRAAEPAVGEAAPPTDEWAEPESAFRMTAAGDAPDDEGPEERVSLLTGHRAVWPHLHRFGQAAGRAIKAVLGEGCRLGGLLGQTIRRVYRLQGVRYGLGVLGVAGLTAGGIWMGLDVIELFDTMSSAPVGVESPAPAPAAVADPFTLQVAAYLKQEYALKLVEELKRKGLDAYWTETSSGGKLWYQVRLSHFPDQPSAREYGRNLKGKGVIDDFYVTHYVR
jgi:hypothetical protein